MCSSCVPVKVADVVASMCDLSELWRQALLSSWLQQVYAGMTTGAPGHTHGMLAVWYLT
jgi:hypothetical protein